MRRTSSPRRRRRGAARSTIACREVRAFAIENALHWLRDYRFDGLRLDAVQQPSSSRASSRCCTISAAPSASLRRRPAAISIWCWRTTTTAPACWTPRQDPPRGKYRAQWNDDYHHAWHVLLTGESQGYYCDYQRSPISDIARALSSGFVYQGEASRIAADNARRAERPSRATGLRQFPAEPRPDRQSRARRPPRKRWPTRERSRRRWRCCCSRPAFRMLFMGEEWGSNAPFPFFCDFDGDLADAVRKGRRVEFAWAYAEYGDEVPDPLAASTSRFRCARLGRARRSRGAEAPDAGARPAEDPPRADRAPPGRRRLRRSSRSEQWPARRPAGAWATALRFSLAANLSDQAIGQPSAEARGTLIWGSELSDSVPPWSVRWHIG